MIGFAMKHNLLPRVVSLGIVGVACAPLATSAHHALAELFDRDSMITLTGTVTTVQWVNPHVVVEIDVTNESGAVEHWEAQIDAPSALMRRGWTRDSISAGDAVVLTGYEPLDGGLLTYGRTITLASGDVLQASTDGAWNWRTLSDSSANQFVAPGGEIRVVVPPR
jgi:hypothetical protein